MTTYQVYVKIPRIVNEMQMFEDNEILIIGTKQTLRALKNGELKRCIIAKDIDSSLFARLYGEMTDKNIPIQFSATMEELGMLAGIDVGCAIVGVKN